MKNKRIQKGKTKAMKKVSPAKKKTWAEIGPLSESLKTANKNFDEMEWTWPSRKSEIKVPPSKTDKQIDKVSMKKTRALQKTEQEAINSNVLKKTAIVLLGEILNSKNPDLTSIKNKIVDFKMIEEDQIKEAFKAGVTYGNGPQTFDYPESRYYCFTYGYSKKG